ncbi:replication initiation and membrane attachment family protein [Bacillus weihaiensis]|uniref:Replication initiation and membrane attachment protein n=1 Tax=Bacillus weihaiensis TaxID=1547283 RepID=A0A1L3MXA2_9BACI|nr:replication initiation and membrane attachment family protein [Bacillus weihaiensis]APH06962.1 Replication initiation and membrane attachment protein [Bacillus weihaiensis]
MEHHWKEILAIDRYRVKSRSVLQDLDRKILTLLYQPLIGSRSFSLYMTLWGELEQARLWSIEKTHHSLMTIMQMNLRDMYVERIKLEGLGLLKTYMVNIDDSRKYVYELQAPLRPNEFFQDGVLNVYLYNRVGKNTFLQLKQFFSDDQMEEELLEVSKSFDDVFNSGQSADMIAKVNDETITDLRLGDSREYMQTDNSGELVLSDDVFDFDLFLSGLSQAIIPLKSITPSVKEVIKKLSYLYGINAIDMKNVVMNSIDQDEHIDIELLRKAARDWYQFQHGDRLPELVDKKQPTPLLSKVNKQNPTKEDQLITQLESISPRQFLMDVSGGVAPGMNDLKIIEDVMLNQKLQPGVVNVLIYYVMLKTDMKLTKGYVDKIASHWTRKEIKTVKAAMELAKEEHRQYQQWAEEKTTKKQKSYKKSPVRKELLPDWLSEDQEEKGNAKEGTKEPSKETDIESEQFEAEKQKLLERIQRYKDKNKE